MFQTFANKELNPQPTKAWKQIHVYSTSVLLSGLAAMYSWMFKKIGWMYEYMINKDYSNFS